MTKTILATLTTLTVLLSSPAFARTDLTEGWTDFPPSQEYKQQERANTLPQYAARTECELPGRTSNYSSSESKPDPKSDLMERLSKALAGDCGKVRTEKNQVICEDYSSCRQPDLFFEDDLGGNPGQSGRYTLSRTVCREWKMEERWRMNPAELGPVEALLIDTQYVNDLQCPISLSYALRPAGKDELYTLRMESAAREVKNLINHDEGGK